MPRHTMPLTFYTARDEERDTATAHIPKRARYTSSSKPSSSTTNGDPPAESTEADVNKEVTERSVRFTAFLSRQTELHQKFPFDMNLKNGKWEAVGPGLGVLCRKNCTSVDTFETLDERSSTPRVVLSEDEEHDVRSASESRLVSIALSEISLLANVLIVLIEGDHSKESDAGMLRRYATLVRCFGKQCYLELMHDCAFNRAFATLACTVHVNNHDLITRIVGVAPPKSIRKNSRIAHHFGVFGHRWRCIGMGTECPSDFELLPKAQTTHLSTLIKNAWNNRRAGSKQTAESVVQVMDLDILKNVLLDRPLLELRHLRDGSAVAIEADDVGIPKGSGSSSVQVFVYWTPLIGDTPFGKCEKTTEQEGLLLPPLTDRRNPNRVIGGASSVRLKMPEAFDFMMHRAVQTYNASQLDAYEFRFSNHCKKQWNWMLEKNPRQLRNRTVTRLKDEPILQRLPGFKMPPRPEAPEAADETDAQVEFMHNEAILDEWDRAETAFFNEGGQRAEYERLYPPSSVHLRPISDVNFGWNECKHRLRDRFHYNEKKKERKGLL